MRVTLRESIACVLGLALSAVTPMVLAHEGHDHGAEGKGKKVMGTVTAVLADKSQLEVKTTDGKAVAVPLDSKTRLQRGKVVVKLADVKVGDRAVVTLADDGATASEVRLSEKKADSEAGAPKSKTHPH
jgi:hypothetical protein